MPQPALHLLLARQSLDRWRAASTPPFAPDDAAAVNAFLHGCLAPDMGNFPGGSQTLAHEVHTRRTGDVVRHLLHHANTDAERAFAAGWLTHVVADALIHPIVNEAAPGGIVEHVRVEVGIDVRLCWQHPALAGLRLAPAFDPDGYAFLARALGSVMSVPVTGARLALMERGVMVFTHAALHFATEVARTIWWRDADAEVPLASALLWHAAALLSPEDSVVNAYLKPRIPSPWLTARVEAALAVFATLVDDAIADHAASLPNWNLEDGTIESGLDRLVA